MRAKVNFFTHAELLSGVGGYKAISEELAEPYPTVAAWAKAGIPVRVWTPIITLARDKGIKVTADMLLMTRPVRLKTERRFRRTRAARSEGAAS